MFSLISGLPSAFSAEDVLSLFECLIGTMPLSDPSGTYIRAMRPWPSPVGLLASAGISEVSRFPCRKCLGVLGVYDYAGPTHGLALSPRVMLPSATLTASAS